MFTCYQCVYECQRAYGKTGLTFHSVTTFFVGQEIVKLLGIIHDYMTVIILISISNFANINKMKIRDKFVTEIFILPMSKLCKLWSYVNNFPFHTLS